MFLPLLQATTYWRSVQSEAGCRAEASAPLDFVGPYCFSGELFGIFLRVRGVLLGLSGQFMSGKMISFAVSGGGGNVGVGRKVVKFLRLYGMP
jgi:hypothetical protein